MSFIVEEVDYPCHHPMRHCITRKTWEMLEGKECKKVRVAICSNCKQNISYLDLVYDRKYDLTEDISQ